MEREQVIALAGKVFDAKLKVDCLNMTNIAGLSIEERRKVDIDYQVALYDYAKLELELRKAIDV